MTKPPKLWSSKRHANLDGDKKGHSVATLSRSRSLLDMLSLFLYATIENGCFYKERDICGHVYLTLN
jgi:hypothetical protein